MYKRTFSFSDSFESKLEALCSLTTKYLSVCLRRTRVISHITKVELSKLGILTLIQYYYLVQSPYLNCSLSLEYAKVVSESLSYMIVKGNTI